jgi:hypothetical protein
MKKIFFISILLVLVIASCKKSSSSHDAGTWTLNGLTYKGQYGAFVRGSLISYTLDNAITGTISLTFNDGRFTGNVDTTFGPQPYHSDTVVSYTLTGTYPPPVGSVYLQLTDSSLYNSYAITGSTTPKVTLELIGGKYKATVPPVMVVNNNQTPATLNGPLNVGAATGTDSSLVSGTLIQTTDK